jgi:uncharacterized membrane protein YeaQ/YmgE (transglycosylase-associated protein family)
MFWFIGWLIVGLIAGALARLLVPGRDPMGLLGTLALGLIGSFIGGFLGYVIFGANIERGAVQTAGLFGSVIGAVIALLIWRSMSARREGTVRR